MSPQERETFLKLLKKAQDEHLIEFVISNDEWDITLRESGVDVLTMDDLIKMDF